MKLFISSLLIAGTIFFLTLIVACSINGVSIPTQFNQWFLS